MKTHILALETSSNRCDVALLECNKPDMTLSRFHDGQSSHTQHILPLVDNLLQQAHITSSHLAAVAFGQGPGGFTGLRVACGVAQGLAFGLAIPVLPVASLKALAWQAQQSLPAQPTATVHIVLQDARMNEVYLAVYYLANSQDKQWQCKQEALLIGVEDVSLWLEHLLIQQPKLADAQIVLSGNAMAAYKELALLPAKLSATAMPAVEQIQASVIARLAYHDFKRGKAVAPEAAVPLYVRDKVAFTRQERLLGGGGNPQAIPLGAQLVPMQPHHLEAVAALEGSIQSFPWTHTNFADALASNYPAWILCLGERVVGFYLAMMAPDVAHLLVIGVHPEFQSKGLGKVLMQHFEFQALAHKLDTLILEVRQSNKKAIAFYKQLGFDTMSFRKDYYPAAHAQRETAYVMKKTLPPLPTLHD